MIENWKRSGESQHLFCKTQCIPISVFQYWHKKYRDDKNATPAAFVPVSLHAMETSSPIVELIFSDGKRIKFYQSVEVSVLRSLLC